MCVPFKLYEDMRVNKKRTSIVARMRSILRLYWLLSEECLKKNSKIDGYKVFYLFIFIFFFLSPLCFVSAATKSAALKMCQLTNAFTVK